MYWPPALFTSVSILPWRSSTPSTSSPTCSSSRMSHTRDSQRPPSHSATVSSSGSGRRPQITTCAPQRGQLDRGRAAEPGAAAGDEHHLAVEQPGGEDPRRHRGGRLSWRAVAAAAEPRPASLPLPGGREGATVRVHPLLTATCHVARGLAAARGGPARQAPRARPAGRRERVEVPISAFLVEHPAPGRADRHRLPPLGGRRPASRTSAASARSRLQEPRDGGPTQAVPAQLRARGSTPSESRLVVMTHLHVDHASAMSEFPERDVRRSRQQEWEAADRAARPSRGYVASASSTTPSTTARSTSRAPTPTRSPPSAARSTCSATAACGSSSRRATRAATCRWSCGWATARLLIAGDAAFTRARSRDGPCRTRWTTSTGSGARSSEIQLYRRDAGRARDRRPRHGALAELKSLRVGVRRGGAARPRLGGALRRRGGPRGRPRRAAAAASRRP